MKNTLLLTFVLLSVALAQNWHTCTEQEKQAVICTMEYSLHCGQTADGHQRTYSNRCNACAGENVVRVIQGSCDLQITQKLSDNNGECTQQDKQVKGCPRIYDPVCGIAGYTVMNFNNRCEACLHYMVQRTYGGHCVGGLQSNSDNGECSLEERQAKFCPSIYRPVCGQMGYVTRDFSNRCEACAHVGVSRTWAGVCNHANLSQSHFTSLCSMEEKQTNACTDDYRPVCGVSAVNGHKQNRKTFANRCTACAVGNFDFLVNGSCEQFNENSLVCNPDEDKSNKACTREYLQTCGTTADGQQRNYSNPCVACSDSDVVVATPGQC